MDDVLIILTVVTSNNYRIYMNKWLHRHLKKKFWHNDLQYKQMVLIFKKRNYIATATPFK